MVTPIGCLEFLDFNGFMQFQWFFSNCTEVPEIELKLFNIARNSSAMSNMSVHIIEFNCKFKQSNENGCNYFSHFLIRPLSSSLKILKFKPGYHKYFPLATPWPLKNTTYYSLATSVLANATASPGQHHRLAWPTPILYLTYCSWVLVHKDC